MSQMNTLEELLASEANDHHQADAHTLRSQQKACE
jgi:hypothetical protein